MDTPTNPSWASNGMTVWVTNSRSITVVPYLNKGVWKVKIFNRICTFDFPNERIIDGKKRHKFTYRATLKIFDQNGNLEVQFG